MRETEVRVRLRMKRELKIWIATFNQRPGTSTPPKGGQPDQGWVPAPLTPRGGTSWTYCLETKNLEAIGAVRRR